MTPRGAVYVGRPSLWANPFLSSRFGHIAATQFHARWLSDQMTPRLLTICGFGRDEIAALDRLRRRVIEGIADLAGCNLQCWCPLTSRWCHADTLIGLANPAVSQGEVDV